MLQLGNVNQLIHIYTVGSPNSSYTKSKKEQCLTALVLVSLKVRDLAFSVFFSVSHAGICRKAGSYDAEDHGQILFI